MAARYRSPRRKQPKVNVTWRVPEDIHEMAVRCADSIGVSLNMFLTEAVLQRARKWTAPGETKPLIQALAESGEVRSAASNMPDDIDSYVCDHSNCLGPARDCWVKMSKKKTPGAHIKHWTHRTTYLPYGVEDALED